MMAALEANDWKNRLMAIRFDNSMAFVCDRAEYEEIQGPTSTVRKIKRYPAPDEYLMFDEKSHMIGMKQPFPMKDRTAKNFDKAYFYSWIHVSVVQGLVFCGEDCLELRPHIDVQML